MSAKIYDKVLVGNTLDELLYKGLKELEDCPIVDSRLGDNTRELIGMSILLKDPRNIWMLNTERKHNVFHQIYESLHVLVGNNKLSHLVKYLPKCGDFSDNWNGTEGSWRAGYGQRIRWFQRNNNGPLEYVAPDDYVDQWRNVVEELKAHPNSRRAVIVLWDPMEDGKFPNSLDYPCNDMIQFLIRDNKLNMIVTQRSSDVIWGYSAINQIEFSLMMQLTASVLGVELGVYRHQMGSFHVYDKHFDRAKLITDDYEYGNHSEVIYLDPKYNFERLNSFDEMDKVINTIYNVELMLRKDEGQVDLEESILWANYKSFAEKYPNIVATLSIPLIYKSNLEDMFIKDILQIIEDANIHPDLRTIFNRRLDKMREVNNG